MAGASRQRENGTRRLGLWLSIAISAAILVGTIGSVFYVAFNGSVNSAKISENEIAIQRLLDRIAMLETRQTKTEVAQNEIETQFCEEGNLRNLMHANDQRSFAVVFEKLFEGQRWHTDNSFYPKTCNR